MRFEIDIDGHGRTVSVAPIQGARYRVVVDGRPHLVDAARTGEFGLSLLLSGDSDEGRRVSRDVQVVPAGSPGGLMIVLDGHTLPAVVNGRRSRRAVGHAATAGGGDLSVAAPMPGRIVRVLVGVGDEVAARQPVVVVEAMKMENELRSPKAGVVKEIAVSAGASVEAGRVLVTIG